jgi:hypothetical protein
MRTDSFSEEAIRAAYEMAAEKASSDFESFVEQSSFFDFAVSSLGANLSMNVECDTGLPVSTPAEKREKLFQSRLSQSQRKANKIADRQRKIQEAVAKKLQRKMRKEQRGKL